MLPPFAKTDVWKQQLDALAAHLGTAIISGAAIYGKLPFFQEIRNREDPAPYTPVPGITYYHVTTNQTTLTCGPFKTNDPHTLSEELAEAREKLPSWHDHFTELITFTIQNTALIAEQHLHLTEALNRAKLLLEYTKAVSASKSLDHALHNTVQFLSHKFKLSNVHITALGKTSRNFDLTPSGKEVEQRILANLRGTNTAVTINNVQTDFLLEGIKDRDKLPTHALGLPLILNREHIGHCTITSEHPVPLENITEVLYELHNYLGRLSEFEQAQTSAVTDALTGLPNRAQLVKTAEKILKEQHGTAPITVVMIDADNFKKYNDTNGHPAGDEVLRIIAKTLAAHTPPGGLSARYGGEEFTLVLPLLSPQDAKQHAENIRSAIEETSPLTASFGMITNLNSTASFERLLKEADDALYRAKTLGKNKVVAKIMLDRNMGVIDG
ncbi:GGDEF domain-containing protein [Candidatus Woesearchaeota archaeon]|nr:MAG: GGDEF domain-containing protein [Candidatus Woesearchaeota archaeon]